MKKTAALIMAVIMILVSAACGKTEKAGETAAQPLQEPAVSTQDENEAPVSGTLPGGWSRPGSPEVTEELRELFDKTAGSILGAEYIPVAYIGRQIVAGTNHEFICREKIVSKDSSETYSIVCIYEDPQGKTGLTEIKNSGVNTWINGLAGGWSQAESPVITDELKSKLDEAFEGLLGADYDPVALLSTQVVAGMNYCVLCEQTVVYPGAEPEYVFVYLYIDLDGNPQITDIVHFAGDAEN